MNTIRSTRRLTLALCATVLGVAAGAALAQQKTTLLR